MRLKILLRLFLSMLKTGLFTFGGGYAMISVLEHEFVEKRGWLTEEEYLDLVTIAESTPGPIAINCSTYIGYKKGGFLGSLISTLGICIPSFTIIFLISLFFDSFMELRAVAAAFKGIQMCVIFLIASAGIRMLRQIRLTPLSCILLALTVGAMLLIGLFSFNFSSIFFILIGAVLGLITLAVSVLKERAKREGGDEE